MTRLVDAGLVDADWAATPTKGQIATSIVSFVVRKGNPKGIKTWDDLLKPGVEVLTPNPFTSGAAKWNLLGAYAAKSDGGKNPEAGLDFLRELITEHVKVQDKSGREALQNFTSGTGDVLLSYEYEAITAKKKGETDIEYVLPDDSIKIETVAAMTKDAPQAAKDFLDYVALDRGPGEVRRRGATGRSTRRPSRPTRTSSRPRRTSTRSPTSVAGTTVNAEMFDPEKGSVAKIEEEAGVSTAQ